MTRYLTWESLAAYILGRSTSAIMYADDSITLTPSVIEMYPRIFGPFSRWNLNFICKRFAACSIIFLLHSHSALSLHHALIKLWSMHWLRSLWSTAFNCSISVRSAFTYCAIIVNQSYTKDLLNSVFRTRHSNFQMFDKVNEDLYKRCLLLYFMLKNKNLSKKTKSTGFARTFWMFDSRRLLLLKIVQMRWVM